MIPIRLSAEELEQLAAHLEESLLETGCDNTTRHTLEWLIARDTGDRDRVIEAIEERGGYCDCEVLHNVILS
jgi:hypothetical protein